MAEVIVFPDTEGAVVDHLNSVLGVPVSTKVKDARPGEFCIVKRTGGRRVTLVTEAVTLTVEYWAQNESAASRGAQLVRGHLWALRGARVSDVLVTKVEEYAGPANLPDPISNQDRYVQTLVLHTRGAAI